MDVSGEVDIYTAPKLRERLVELVESGRHDLVLNLENVQFMDSTGLGVLVGTLKRVKEKDGSLALAAPNRTIQRVLSITGLDTVFPIKESVAGAAE